MHGRGRSRRRPLTWRRPPDARGKKEGPRTANRWPIITAGELSGLVGVIVEKAIVLRFDGPVTLAGCVLKPLQIQNCNVPTPVPKKTGLLEHMGCGGNTASLRAQHLAEELLGDRMATSDVPRNRRSARSSSPWIGWVLGVPFFDPAARGPKGQHHRPYGHEFIKVFPERIDRGGDEAFSVFSSR
jgi:hypothetical protein